MSASKLRTLLVAVIAIVTAISLTAAPAFADPERTKVNTVTGTGMTAPKYGDSVVAPPLTVTSTDPASAGVVFEFGFQGQSSWQKQVGSNWVDVEFGDTFTPGTWRYRLDVEINSETYFNSFFLDTSTIVTVDGTSWGAIDIQPNAEANKSSWGYAYSPPFAIAGLTFTYDPSFDIPENTVGTPITPISVASGASGGVGTHAFTKAEGPDWLHVGSDGTIMGTPEHEGTNDPLVVLVADESGQDAMITISVGNTYDNGDTRTVISAIEGTSDGIDSAIGTDKEIDFVEFMTTAGAPATIDGWMGWQVKVGDDWEWAADVLPDGTTFEGGVWRYVAQARLDGTAAESHKFSPSLTLKIDGKEWYADEAGATNRVDEKGEKFSDAIFYSPEYELDVKTIDAVEAAGVTVPVPGTTPVTSGITSKTEHATINSANTYWVVKNDGVWYKMAPTDKFAAGKEYAIYVCLSADDGYAFSPLATGKVDGVNALEVEKLTGTNRIRLLHQVEMAQPTNAVYVVTAGALNVRAGASADSARVGGLAYGDVVQAKAISGGWAMIDFNGQDAWVNKAYLALTYSKESAFVDGPVYYTVAAGAMNVRKNISMLAKRIGGVTNGKQVLATGARMTDLGQTWLVIDYFEGTIHQLGYILFSHNTSTGTSYFFTGSEVAPVNEPAIEDSEAIMLSIVGKPAKVTLKSMAAPSIANGDNLVLTDENIALGEDGMMKIVVYPDDAKNFDNLTADKVKLPDGFGYRIYDFTLNADGSVTILLEPEGFTYSCVEDAGGQYVTGSGEPLKLVFKRSQNDAYTYSRFVGLQVDGVLIDEANYTKAPGSVVITILPAFLETLSEGDHTFSALFSDSDPVNVTVAVKAAPVASVTSTGVTKKAVSAPKAGYTRVPNTGDTLTGLATLFGATAIAAAAVMFATLHLRSRRGKHRR